MKATKQAKQNTHLGEGLLLARGGDGDVQRAGRDDAASGGHGLERAGAVLLDRAEGQARDLSRDVGRRGPRGRGNAGESARRLFD